MSVPRTPLVVLTSDFKPQTGGVAEYLHQLWSRVGQARPVHVFSSVPALSHDWQHDYVLHALPAAPDRRMGGRLGDGVPLVWRLNGLAYTREVRHYADATIATIRAAVRSNAHVFVGSWWGELSHAWCAAMREARMPYSIFIYGMELVRAEPRWGVWRKEDLEGAARVIACSRGTAQLASGLGLCLKGDIAVVTPGIDAATAAKVSTKDSGAHRVRLGLSEKRIVLFVGRLVARKGCDLSIRAIAALASDYPDLALVVIGDGSDRPRLERLVNDLGIQKHIVFLGRADDSLKATLYEACEFLVMPNRTLGGTDWEGFGIVFLEAALHGRTSIGGDNGGVTDAIEDEITGLLVDTERDEVALTSAMRRLLQDRAWCRALGEAARQRARAAFSWDAIGAKFSQELEEAMP